LAAAYVINISQPVLTVVVIPVKSVIGQVAVIIAEVAVMRVVPLDLLYLLLGNFKKLLLTLLTQLSLENSDYYNNR
jgi:hypothetical protein